MNLIESLSVFGIPKEKTLCFTGHRPEKLPQEEQLTALLNTLKYYIDIAIQQGYELFLDGMADGIDYFSAEYLFQKREKFPQIRVAGVQPCRNYEAFFKDRHYDMKHLKLMQNQMDGILCLNGEYLKANRQENGTLFLERNKFLVQNSDALIAVCSKKGRSGSCQTVRYAEKNQLHICRIEANPNLLYVPAPEQWPVEKINF